MTKRAKKPKAEITPMAQWGKEEPLLPFCTPVVGLVVGVEDEPELVGESEEDEVADMDERTELA